jgi:hypothetical protein
VGTGYWQTGLWVDSPKDLIKIGAASHNYWTGQLAGTAGNQMGSLMSLYVNWIWGGGNWEYLDSFPANYALDNQPETTSAPALTSSSGWQTWTFTFDAIQDISALEIKAVSDTWATDPYFNKADGIVQRAWDRTYDTRYTMNAYYNWDGVRYGASNGWGPAWAWKYNPYVCSYHDEKAGWWPAGDPYNQDIFWNPQQHSLSIRKFTTGRVMMYDAGGEVIFDWLNGKSGDIRDTIIVNDDGSFLGTGIKQIIISGDNRWFDFTKKYTNTFHRTDETSSHVLSKTADVDALDYNGTAGQILGLNRVRIY